MNYHILCIRPIGVCYNATSFYINNFGRALDDLGYDITFFDLIQGDPTTRADELISLDWSSIDCIFDINSRLPELKDEASGGPALNLFDTPLVNFIIDHPLYHHNMLEFPVDNYHVITLDRYHSEYVRTYYPGIKSVHTMLLSALSTSDIAYSDATSPYDNHTYADIPWNNRNNDVTFIATYNNPHQMKQIIDNLPDNVKNEVNTLIDMMKCDISLSLEDAMMTIINNAKATVSTDVFAAYMNTYFIVDTYLRASYREQLVLTLLNAGIPLRICGHGWDTLETSDNCKKLMTLTDSMNFKDTFKLLSDSKIALNLNPLFKSAIHDRVFSGTLNKSLVLTNPCELIRQDYTDALAVYELNNIDAVPQMVHDILSHPDTSSTTAQKGYEITASKHSFKARGHELDAILRSVIS